MSGRTSATDSENITNEHAVVLRASPDDSLTDYLRAVSNIVGSSHIHSIYRDGDYVKIYMKEKKFVQVVVNAGIVVKGHMKNIDFLVPPSYKILLSNVDPIIPDARLKSLLSPYGTFDSEFIHQKITEAEGYSHIESGSRVVYMTPLDDKKIPSRFHLVCENIPSVIDVRVEPPVQMRYAGSQTD